MIHVVHPAGADDWVITRLARYLDRNGWTRSHEPNRKARINLFMPYLVWTETHFDKTPIAALFTHREHNRADKDRLWDSAARCIDTRLTMAAQYVTDLERYGPTAKVSPPVELDLFTPGELRHNGKPRVGVSGYVYPGGRKGEALVKRLADDRPPFELVASGKGWPVETRAYAWRELPDFYRSLDVYLCTAVTEGIPMPPLEALACGVPVVVPVGVGMLDELPDMPGIYHYEAGDYAAMRRAIAMALEAHADAATLRDVVAGFTIDAYAQGMFQALDAERVAYTAPGKGKAGIYVVAFGEPARECATRCIAAVKAHEPNLPMALVSDRPLGGEDVFIEQPDADIGARTAKLKVYDLAPAEWEYVLYLDADTEPREPFGFLLDVLRDGWEFVICKDMQRFALARTMIRPDNRPEATATWAEVGSDEVLQYNGGVFAFRRCGRVKTFFDRWTNEWQRWAKRDQGALLRAMHSDPLRMYVLSNMWNASDRYPVDYTPVIWHHNIEARRWRGIINGRLDGEEAWSAVENWDGRRDR